MKNLLICFIFILFAININEKDYILFSICAGIYFLGLIADEISELTKQKKENSEKLLRSIESIGLDLTNSLNSIFNQNKKS